MTLRESMSKAVAELDEAMIAMLVSGPRSPLPAVRIREAREHIRLAIEHLESGLSGPRVARSKRIAREVEMTGLEQDLWS